MYELRIKNNNMETKIFSQILQTYQASLRNFENIQKTGDNDLCPSSEYQTAEPLIKELSKEEVEITIRKLKPYKTATEVIKAGRAYLKYISWTKGLGE